MAACKLSRTCAVVLANLKDSKEPSSLITNLELNFCFSNVLFTSTAARNLLCLYNLIPDSLHNTISTIPA